MHCVFVANTGLVHWLLLNSETDYLDSYEGPNSNFAGHDFGGVNGVPTQLQWLEDDLKSINRTATPWVIATAHRPLYSSDSADVASPLITPFESLFTKYGVDMYFAGHIHWYVYSADTSVVLQYD